MSQSNYSLSFTHKHGTSFNVELIPIGNKKYAANTLYNSFDVEIIDAESRYMNNRKGAEHEEQSYISTPMPGKVVKILVEEGQEVKAGESVQKVFGYIPGKDVEEEIPLITFNKEELAEVED